MERSRKPPALTKGINGVSVIKIVTILISLLAIALLIYIGLGVLLYLAQGSFLYYPTAHIKQPYFTEQRVESAGESLQLWTANPGQPSAIIYFGGNAENAHDALAGLVPLLPAYTLYGVNYRGYGDSSGKPTETGLFTDAVNIYDRLRPEYTSISVIGRSLGSGIAVFLATQRDINKLALITPYDSIANIASNQYPIYPVRWLLRDHYDSLPRAGDIKTPTLMLIAQYDRLIPPDHALALASAMPQHLLQSIIVPEAGHNNITEYPYFRSTLERYFR